MSIIFSNVGQPTVAAVLGRHGGRPYGSREACKAVSTVADPTVQGRRAKLSARWPTLRTV